MRNNNEMFIELLEQENKEEAVAFALNLLKSGETDIIQLYTEFLTPALNNMVCKLADKSICIWKEHVRTAIVRTIVECCYPYVIEKKKEFNFPVGKTAVVICPPEEYHDLGARMVADFFTICGFHSIFVGSNTPYHDFYNAVDVIHPDLIAISVSNYYNLVSTKKIIEDLKKEGKRPFKIVVGGYAFDKNQENCKMVGADFYAHSFEDIKRIAGEGVNR